MKKKFAIKKVHIKGGVLGGGIGAILASLFLAMSPMMFLIAIGGFVAIYVVRKEIKLSYLEGMKIGLISALIASLYALLLLERTAIAAKKEILEQGIEAFMENHNITWATEQQVFDAYVTHTHGIPIQWTLTVFIIMLTGTWIALIFYKPRTKKMH
ncbi:MAG: hypothetical protein KAT49_06560 [Methanomicrobia archaeon]|nr:hypothetical protein [Methanomicrobia archaeon]MCK4637525.1 hypothetical protein [Methanomicrobia archaeon]